MSTSYPTEQLDAEDDDGTMPSNDAGDVLELTVGWSPGNPFYYGYGFDIDVIPVQ